MESYEDILKRMTEKYTEITGAVPHEASDISIRLRVLSGEIYNSLVSFEWLKRQMFPDTAQGEYLDRHAQSRGICRREAGYASGEVTFMVGLVALADVEIPCGTIVATSGDDPLRFETTRTATIHIGSSQAIVPVRALKPGKKYNVSAGTVTVMVTPPVGVNSIRNADAFEGGSEIEDDESLRSRIIESYKFASNGTNCAYYKNLALEVPGVSGASVVPKSRGAGTVDVYISCEGKDAGDEVLDKVQAIMNLEREVNVDVSVDRAQPRKVSFYLRLEVKDGYEFSAVKARCEGALRDYVASVDVGGRVLLTEAGDKIYHTEGVREYSFDPMMNFDTVLGDDEYATIDRIVITEGVRV